jgi:hypothetical protein
MFPTPSTSFDPAIRGFPETVYGYPVVAIITPSIASCLSDRMLLMILQTSAQNHIDSEGIPLYYVLERRLHWHSVEHTFRWEVAFVESDVTIEQAIADYRTRQSCTRLGGPIIIPCPRDVAGLIATRTCS